jgi:hypothetical protein
LGHSFGLGLHLEEYRFDENGGQEGSRAHHGRMTSEGKECQWEHESFWFGTMNLQCSSAERVTDSKHWLLDFEVLQSLKHVSRVILPAG